MPNCRGSKRRSFDCSPWRALKKLIVRAAMPTPRARKVSRMPRSPMPRVLKPTSRDALPQRSWRKLIWRGVKPSLQWLPPTVCSCRMQSLTAREEARGSVITLGDAVFAPGRSQLQPDAIANLDTIIEFVNRDPSRKVRIEGHTDASGSDNANQVLSQQRAEAVRAALSARGVDMARMAAIGRGESVPVASNSSAEGKARNRRVEIILIGI